MSEEVIRKQRNKYDVDEALESPFSFKHFKRSNVYIKRHAKQIFAALFYSIITILSSLSYPYLLKIIADDLIPQKNIPGMFIVGGVGIVLLVIIVLTERARELVSARMGQQIVSEIRSDLFAHLQKLPFDYYDSRPHGKILVRVVNYVNSVAQFFSNGLVNVVLELLTLLFIMFFMFSIDAGLTLLVLTGMLPFFVYVLIIKTAQRKASRAFSNKTSNMNAYYQESINGMKVTQSFVREEVNQSIAERIASDCRWANIKLAAIMHSMFPSVIMISSLATAAIYLVGINAINTGASISLGVIISMGAYCGHFWQPIQRLGVLYNQVINTAAYLERIFEVMDIEVEIKDKPGARELPPIKGEVSFKNVYFEYEKGIPILEDLSFTAKPGDSIALVGPTGAGKTTVVNLIARFYDIQSGSITIDDISIYDVTLRSLRSQLGIMLQDTFIFSGTIMDNIKYGRLDATDEEAIEAAKTVHAHEFIQTLPNGYQTYVTERGSSLSAGQRQLISFARTLLANPRILILDEATSSIDTKTELLVQQGLQNLLKGRTSFIIAHRLSTIKNCDKILYIAGKNIAEAGSHQELLAARGLYYELYRSQLADD